jgi:hypothetical protein
MPRTPTPSPLLVCAPQLDHGSSSASVTLSSRDAAFFSSVVNVGAMVGAVLGGVACDKVRCAPPPPPPLPRALSRRLSKHTRARAHVRASATGLATKARGSSCATFVTVERARRWAQLGRKGTIVASAGPFCAAWSWIATTSNYYEVRVAEALHLWTCYSLLLPGVLFLQLTRRP